MGESRSPDFDLYTVHDTGHVNPDGTTHEAWTHLGVAWRNPSGDLSIILDSLPAPFLDPQSPRKGSLKYRLVAKLRM